MKILFKPLGALYFPLISIHICAWMYIYVFIDKLSQTTVPMVKASCVAKNIYWVCINLTSVGNILKSFDAMSKICKW